MRSFTASALLLLLSAAVAAQENSNKTRVYINESQSWEIEGGIGGVQDGIGGGVRGGARPQTAEIIKTFNQRCPSLTITSKQDRADYTVLLQHEGGKDLIRRDNKFAVFNKDGDALVSGSTRSLGNAVKDACQAILNDLKSGSARPNTSDN
jgi:hypothetical protein